MTEITAPKSAVTAEQFADEIREQLKYTQGVTVEQAKPGRRVRCRVRRSASPSRGFLDEDPGRHGQRQHQGRGLPVR